MVGIDYNADLPGSKVVCSTWDLRPTMGKTCEYNHKAYLGQWKTLVKVTKCCGLYRGLSQIYMVRVRGL